MNLGNDSATFITGICLMCTWPTASVSASNEKINVTINFFATNLFRQALTYFPFYIVVLCCCFFCGFLLFQCFQLSFICWDKLNADYVCVSNTKFAESS